MASSGVEIAVAAGVDVLAAVWFTASILKLIRLSAFVDATYGIVPGFLFPAVPVAARALPFVELVLAASLLVPGTQGLGLALSTAILLCFFGLLLWGRAVGIRASCACFGAADDEPVDAAAMIRTAALNLLSIVLLFTVLRSAPVSNTSGAYGLQAILLAAISAGTAGMILTAIRLRTTVETALLGG